MATRRKSAMYVPGADYCCDPIRYPTQFAKLGVFNIMERVFSGTPGTNMWMVRGWEGAPHT